VKIRLEGDSLSVGASSPGGQLAALLRGAGHSVEVDAKEGRHLSEVTPAGGASLVLVFLGTNDLSDVGAEVSQLVALVDAEERAGAERVLYLSPPCFGAGVVGSWGGALAGPSKDLASRAARAGLEVVDVGALSCDLVGERYRGATGIHFTVEGAQILGRRLAEVILARLGPAQKVVYPLEADVGPVKSSAKGATWQLERFAIVYTPVKGSLTLSRNVFGPGTWNAVLQHAQERSLFSSFGPFEAEGSSGPRQVEVETPIGEARGKIFTWQLYDDEARKYLDPLLWAESQGARSPRSTLRRLVVGGLIGAGVIGAGWLAWKLIDD